MIPEGPELAAAARAVVRRAQIEHGGDAQAAAAVYTVALCAICAELGTDPVGLVAAVMAELRLARQERGARPPG